jgi:hypothetical protein
MIIADIQTAIRQGTYFAGSHAQSAAIDDHLAIADIWSALCDAAAEIIEDYPSNPRGASCLILCFVANRPVHVQIAYPAKQYAAQQQIPALAFMVTVYRPDASPHKWSADFRTRMPQP